MRVSLLTVLAGLSFSAALSAQVPSLSTREMVALVREEPEAFARAWETRFDTVAKDAQGDALAEARAARARGYIDYAYFHWRETGRVVPASWPARARAEAAVDINDAQALPRAEHRAFLEAWLRAEARARVASDAGLMAGDNRWLRARFAAVESRVTSPAVRRKLLYDALAAHIDDNGVRGVPELLGRYVTLTGASPADVEPLRKAVTEGLALLDGHRIETYKTVDGVGLQAHVFAPAAAGPRPALIWFHGGSWSTGAWSYCPTVCRVARERDFVVIQIEYRTDERFASGPLAAIQDARDALAWTRAHAAELGVDSARVTVAGFSSGGSMAAILATSSPAGALRGAVLMSACTAPLGDSWFRRVTEGRVGDADLTPAAHLDAADPAILAVHGDADEACPYADTAAFAETAKRAGVAIELVTLPGATHFFPFRSPEARTRAADAIAQFLARR
jgi:acetyl esterase/lipase